MMHDRPIGFPLILIAVGLAALTAACASSTDQPPSDTAIDADVGGEGEVTSGGLLLVSNRTQLSLCVDGAGGFSVSDDEVDRVRDALEGVLAAADNPPSEYSDRAVSRSCPPPTALTGSVLDYGERYGFGVLSGSGALETAGDASRHRLHVYVVPPDVYATSFGADAYATTAEDLLCDVDVCIWLTQGLYITPSTGSDVISRALRSVLVLNPPLPEPTVYAQVCLSGTPEEWCYQYNYCQAVPTDATCEDDVADPTARPETPISEFR